MDPSSSSLVKYLHDEITPVVMVLSSPLAEQACRKNDSLSFVQMLRPFSVFNNVDVPVRTASDQPYRIQSFKLRMVYASDVHQPDQEVIVNNLKEVVSRASEEATCDLQSDPLELDALLSTSDSNVHLSWIHNFNRDLSQAVSFSDHEAIDHPVACLVVVSSKDEHPIEKINDLLSGDQLPDLLNHGVMDPRILKRYVLLHDKCEDSIEKASGILSEMRSTFGLNECRMLCVNSNKDVAVELQENLRVHPGAVSSQSQDITCFLCEEDVNEIKAFMQDLSTKNVIPYMEQKIRILNQQVSVTRKGFKNQIKNLWWRKGKEDAPDTPSGPMYTYSSTESQIRVLGDYAFMMRDYELALSNYRLLSTDYKLDKAWKRFAGVQEMMALSLFMLDQSKKESEYCMETAFNTYLEYLNFELTFFSHLFDLRNELRPRAEVLLKLKRTRLSAYLKMGSSGSKNAIRCGLWWAEMLKARGQHKEAASVLSRISNEGLSLQNAVVLEQASYCYLLCTPPMLRKFAFHLVLAGHCYNISDQWKHAIRTCRSALAVYEGNAWSYINDHVHFNIGRWYSFLDMREAAVKHLEVLQCTQQSPATQDLFLKDFFRIVQSTGRKLEVDKLRLPSVDVSSLKVIFEDHRTFASSSAVHVRESLWQLLEENMVPPINAVKSNWLESKNLQPPRKHNDDSISMVGEAIRIFLEVRNPLQIPISVSGMFLVCELTTKSTTETGEDTSNVPPDSDVHRGSSSTRDQNDDCSLLELSDQCFVLGGSETRKVELDVTPKVEGYLKIVGVKWMLSGCVSGYHSFDFNARKKRRKAKGIGSSSRHNLCFTVVKGLPKLEGYINHVPEVTHNGDLRPLVLELKNKSEYSVKDMKMKISHPRFLIPGSSREQYLEFPDCLRKQSSSDRWDTQANIMDKSGGLLFTFPKDTKIQRGQNFQWPLWLHTPFSGRISFYLSIYYEMEDFSCDTYYRTLRMHYELEVLPSLHISIFISPCTSNMQEFLVRMEIASRSRSKSFWLCQLSSVGRWQISSLPAHASVCSTQLLLAGQELVCFFKLKDHGEMASEHILSDQISDIRLDLQQDSAMLFDASRTPLVDFHHYERLHQEKSVKETHGVDFVLLSQLVGDTTNGQQKEQIELLSHHACNYSVVGTCPLWWSMDGPRTIRHDFSVPFCEAIFYLTIQNCSESAASVKITTIDCMASVPGKTQDASSPFGSSAAGWHNISLMNDSPVTPELAATRSGKKPLESVSPFIWCASSTTQIELEPVSVKNVPLRICLFSPGIYDISNYELHWNLQVKDATRFSKDLTWSSSGVKKGYPYILTVLQSIP